MRKLILAMIIAIVIPVASARTITEEYRTEVQKYLELNKVRANVEQTMMDLLKDPGILLKVSYEEAASIAIGMIWDAYVEDITDLYNQYLSLEDLKQINAFFATEAGQNLVNANPIIFSETTKLMQDKYTPLMAQTLMNLSIQ